jgi:DNA ligase-1
MAQIMRQYRDGRCPEEVVKVPLHKVFKPSELAAYEQECVDKGFEGVMLRKLAADTPYKFGRSTLKEALLMKLIRRNTMEGVVVDAVEQLHNANEKTLDARGYAKRSKVKANLVPTGKLGALVLTADRDTKAPVITTFEVGTGFTDEQRIALWQDRKRLKGKLVTVEYREMTKDNVPRFPVFKGFRHANDVS